MMSEVEQKDLRDLTATHKMYYDWKCMKACEQNDADPERRTRRTKGILQVRSHEAYDELTSQ